MSRANALFSAILPPLPFTLGRPAGDTRGDGRLNVFADRRSAAGTRRFPLDAAPPRLGSRLERGRAVSADRCIPEADQAKIVHPTVFGIGQADCSLKCAPVGGVMLSVSNWHA
jgi:hypothetical protein